MFTDAESPGVRNFIANYKEECFVFLIKKMILLKKIKIENCFLVGLSAAIRTGPLHRHVFAMTYRIKSVLKSLYEISKALEISDQQISMKV